MRAEAEPFYREGGEAIGELLCRHPEREPMVWSLVAGTGIWKRWYLRAFKAIWRLENRQAYNALKSGWHRHRNAAQEKADRLEAEREAAKAAMPTKHLASERPEGPQA